MAQTGNVGINTVMPKAMLHVADSSVLFTGAPEFVSNPGPTPVSGEGTRMMWYADKAAFRVGRVQATNWDRDSIGMESFGAGWDAKAKGDHSIALGSFTQALGSASVALGNNTKAVGGQSTSMGFLTVANGLGSTSMGWQTSANGFAAFANGLQTVAQGDYSMAMNSSTQARGNVSTAFGRGTITNAYASLVAGMYNDTVISLAEGSVPGNNLPLFVVGNGSDANNRKNALVVRSNGRIGIGTNAPAYRLHIYDPNPGVQLAQFNSNGSYGEILVGNSTNRVDLGVSEGWGYVGTKEAIDFYLRTGAVERMTLKHATGNVGIGTTNPSSRLHVLNPTINAVTGRFSSQGGYNEILVENTLHQVDLGVSTAWGYVGTKDTADFRIRTGTATRMSLDHQTGNVGIGTVIPTSRIHVETPAMNASVGKFFSAGGYGEIVVGSQSAKVDLGCWPTLGYVGTKDGLDLSIRTGGATRMFVDHQTKHVGIGTGTPTSRIHVTNDVVDVIVGTFTSAGGFGEIVVGNGTHNVQLGANTDHGYVGSKDSVDLHLTTGETTRVTIKDGSGFVGIGTSAPSRHLEVNGDAAKPGGGTWLASSDARLKQNIAQFTDGLQHVLNIEPVTFQYNVQSGYDTSATHVGVIAQELEKIAPYMVSTMTGDSSTAYLQVDNSAMTYMLINAVKEQQSMIGQLLERIEGLEAGK